jgi:hypothetical protein
MSELGVWIERDIVQEKHVNLIRGDTGHVYRRGHQPKIEESASAATKQASEQHIKHAVKMLGQEQGAALQTTKTFPDWANDPRSVKAYCRTFTLLVKGRYFRKGLSKDEKDDRTLTSAIDGKPLDHIKGEKRRNAEA